MSPSTVQRILTAVVLKPHRLRYFLTRTDPWFAEKMAEILDVWHRPDAVGFSAWMRRLTSKPWSARSLAAAAGLVERQEFEYIRYGTVDLFAAFDVGTGEVFAQCYQRHTNREFRHSARAARSRPDSAGI